MDILKRRTILAMLASAALAACGGKDAKPPPPVPSGANVVIQWNQANLQAIRVTKPGPPMSARQLAIVSTAMYDAWAAYDTLANGTQLGGSLRRPSFESNDGYKSKAISYAAYEALVDQYPSQKAAFVTIMQNMGYDPAVVSSDTSTPEGIGHAVASALLSYRHKDGSNQLGDLTPPDANGNPVPYADYTGYQPRNAPMNPATPTPLSGFTNPANWQPLTYVNQAGATVTPKYIGPFWGRVTPFALSSGSQLRPPPPVAFGSPAYMSQLQEIISLTASLNDRNKAIADYWADGPNSELPPGHWHLFAQFVSQRDHHTLDDDAKMFFALSNAVFDAGIAVWDAKRTYDTSRPITAIRYLMSGQTIQGWGGPGLNNVSMDGSAWIPFQPSWFPTPPFSEYTSGHSAFSSAAAEVLRRFTGSDVLGTSTTIPAHSLKAEPQSPASDVTLSWDTFTTAAVEAGLSRRYGGIHFQDGDMFSRTMGTQAGALVYAKAQGYWNGASQ